MSRFHWSPGINPSIPQLQRYCRIRSINAPPCVSVSLPKIFYRPLSRKEARVALEPLRRHDSYGWSFGLGLFAITAMLVS